MRLIFLAFVLGVLLLVCAAARSDTEPETVTLTRAQINQLQKDFEAIVKKREDAAFEAGRQDAKERCASLI